MSTQEYVWVFDGNYRVYPPPEPGKAFSTSAPIWREHWRKRQVIGETTRSWILSDNTKVPKKGANPRAFLFSEEDLNRAVWLHEHKYPLIRAIERCYDPYIIMEIAKVINYPEVP